ncbi:MAG: transcriptional regulator NrdR [Phormidesmis priestleyi]|uniref:Transcriptional repressor NrdR n=1 Tax=Phormidesmis priestleyi TaxID=268141 RepID=A0A2W4Z2Z3_9CYAN|nr:MAG: transcriptional regulator NrdR [Phormidesmis priestleyi]
MQCPFCQHPNNRVLESRSAESDRSIRRRRECMNCERRFTTYERIEYVPVTVLKRGGDRESFDRSKLLRGIVTACEKTGVSPHAIELLVDEIEADIQQKAVKEVTSEEIGERVLNRLQRLSEVAYVRFASVYRQFQGIRDFTETMSQLESQLENDDDALTLPPSAEAFTSPKNLSANPGLTLPVKA